MAERSEVLAHAKLVHAEGIKRAAERRQSALEESLEDSEGDAEKDTAVKKKGPSEPRWMLLCKAKFESYSELRQVRCKEGNSISRLSGESMLSRTVSLKIRMRFNLTTVVLRLIVVCMVHASCGPKIL